MYTSIVLIVDTDPETFDPGTLPAEVLESLEADSFWCLSALLDGIQVLLVSTISPQDNYIFAQPGIQRMVSTLRELITRIDAPLAKHLNDEGIEFIQFSFRWMNCLLMREFSVTNVIRMWDTYVVSTCIQSHLTSKSEGQKGFSEFHVYVCAALLDKYNSHILSMDFQVSCSICCLTLRV